MIDGAWHVHGIDGELVADRHHELGGRRDRGHLVWEQLRRRTAGSAAAELPYQVLLESASGLETARTEVALRSSRAPRSPSSPTRTGRGSAVDAAAPADRDFKPENTSHRSSARAPSGARSYAATHAHLGASVSNGFSICSPESRGTPREDGNG